MLDYWSVAMAVVQALEECEEEVFDVDVDAAFRRSSDDMIRATARVTLTSRATDVIERAVRAQVEALGDRALERWP